MNDTFEFHRDYQAIRGGVGVTALTDLAVFRLSGNACGAFLDQWLAGPIERLAENSILWTVLLDDEGRVAADVQLYNEFDAYLLTCSTTVRDTVREALAAAMPEGVMVQELTDGLGALTVEGPEALDLPASVLGAEASGLPPLRFVHCMKTGVLLGRVGFSGEFAYVLFTARERLDALRDRILDAAPNAVLCSGAARNVLRLEMRHPNPALDFPRGETALQGGLHWMIHFRKPRFRGRDAVLAEKTAGLTKQLVCVTADGDNEPAANAALSAGDTNVGYVAHTAWSPALRRRIGLAYVDATYACVDVVLDVQGGQHVQLVSAPFVITESSRRGTQ